jgi:hypothetical protein
MLLHMLPKATLNFRLNFRVYLLVLVLFLWGCKIAPRKDEALKPANPAVQKVFNYPFETVWRATQVALKYPIVINNMDNGQLETDWIRSADGFITPSVNNSNVPSAGVRYKIQILMVKGKIDSRESIRLTLLKKVQRQRDFFSEPDELESDGVEEKILIYRIEREIQIDEALKKAAKRGKL